jgi:hypothetical protein
VTQDIVERGRELKSDFVCNSVGEVQRDRFVDEIFPIGGHSAQQDENGNPLRKKFFESYMYSDPLKSGR